MFFSVATGKDLKKSTAELKGVVSKVLVSPIRVTRKLAESAEISAAFTN